MLKELVARLMVNRSKSRQYPVEYLERKHVKLDEPFPNDSSYFYGSDKAGNAFITRMAFRGPNRPHEYWFDFRFPEVGFFGIKDDPGPDGEGFQMGELKWAPVEVGKKWRVSYQGPVKDGQGQSHPCRADLLFTGEHPVYDYAKSSDRNLIAKAIASESRFIQHLEPDLTLIGLRILYMKNRA